MVLPFLFFVLPWIHFYDSSLNTPAAAEATLNVRGYKIVPVTPHDAGKQRRISSHAKGRNPHKDKMQPKVKYRTRDRVKFYFTAPVTKFHYSMVGEMHGDIYEDFQYLTYKLATCLSTSVVAGLQNALFRGSYRVWVIFGCMSLVDMIFKYVC